MRWRTRDLVVAAAATGILLTVAIAADPSVRLAFETRELRTAMEMTQAIIAAVVAYLVYGRVKRRRSLNDLAIVFGLGLLSASNLFFAAIPAELGDKLVFQTWAPLGVRLVATLAFAYAALAADRPLPARIERPGVAVVVATDLVLATVALVVAGLTPILPQAVTVVGDTVGTADLHGHGVLVTTLGAMAGLAMVTAWGFARRAEGRHDALVSSLAVGAVLTGFAFFCYAIYPSVDTEIIQSGDFLQLGCFLVLLVGAEREVDRYWSRLAGIAIYEERRRLARDLHDGVAQELAFVVTQTRLLQRGHAPAGTDDRIAAAAERALDESRRAIIALSLRDDEPLHLALARAAEDVAGRVGVDNVLVDVPPAAVVDTAVREGLVRIVQEAVANAGRHGGAQKVTVALEGDVLRIVDDGTGFDPAGGGSEGRFGLVAMRERAERIGGSLSIASAPGAGTTVEVRLP